MKLPNDVELKLNQFEFGYLYAAVYEKRLQMPTGLKLKLEIEAVKAYLNHPTMGDQAKKELQAYTQALKELDEPESELPNT